MDLAYRKRIAAFYDPGFEYRKLVRDIRRMERDLRTPLKPRTEDMRVRMERYWATREHVDGWVCHVSGSGIAVADWGKNQVQALRNAKALHKKLLKEKRKYA